jgi:drug/metabolite transporter (DMT)-like permease
MSAKVQSLLQTTAPWRYQLVLLLSVMTGGWASIFGRVAQHEHVPSIYMIAFRAAFGALVLTPIVLTQYREELRRLKRRDILITAFAGVWFALHLTSGFTSLEHTSVLVNNVIGGTSPLWIALLEVGFLKARFNQMTWVGLFVTLGGGIIITLSSIGATSLGNNPVLGIVLALGAATAGAVYAVVGRGSRGRIAFLPYIWLVFTFGAITQAVLMVINRVPVTGYSSTGYLALILLAVVPQLIGHTTYNYVLRHLSATYCGIVGQLGVVMGALLALVFFHEIPDGLQIMGSAVILGGVILVNLGQARAPEPEIEHYEPSLKPR